MFLKVILLAIIGVAVIATGSEWFLTNFVGETAVRAYSTSSTRP
jgi:hypothetical protein